MMLLIDVGPEGIVAKAQLKKVVEWLDGLCPDRSVYEPDLQRKHCEGCWQSLLKEVEK
ncbi:hypothetical protein LCGC14_1405660 [marine sediment metagenome]|uniref:Uncharacterized protein n=1 Tax=marine sediment metagenome TaxID=412755 RepID=A0A0F9MB74_9ZZZZ